MIIEFNFNLACAVEFEKDRQTEIRDLHSPRLWFSPKGIAGLSCAKELSSSGKFDCTVFDTGRLRPGGRCSSRLVGDLPKEDAPKDQYPILSKQIIDHAAQILTVPGAKGYEEFQRQVDEWEAQGIIVRYPKGTVCDIIDKKNGDGGFSLQPINKEDNDKALYYGSGGMGSIPLSMARSGGTFHIEQDVWVSPSNGLKYQRGEKQNWKLQANGKMLGLFDRVVIAHNGKCADRLMSKAPTKKLHSLLRVNFSPSVPKWGGKQMTLNSIYSLTIALNAKSSISEALPKDNFVCGFIKNEPTLRFLSCVTRKHNNDNGDENPVEVWTVLSSATFAKKHKGPQEFLPLETVSNVTSLLLNAVERSLGLQTDTLSEQVLESRLQLWGAAVPLNVWTESNGDSSFDTQGFLYDAEFGAGVCGDWLLEPSIAGAWESGRRLAKFLNEGSMRSVGLPPDGQFTVSAEASKAGIGALR